MSIAFSPSSGYAQYPNPGASLGVGAYPLTVACWFYVTTVSGNQTILQVGLDGDPGTGGQGNQLLLWQNGATTTMFSSSFAFNLGLGTITNNTWNHVAVTISGARAAVGYLNGVQGNTGTAATHTNQFMIKIGATPGFTGNAVAEYQDVSLWSRQLSASEVNQLFRRRGLFMDHTGLQAWYPGLGGGTRLNDLSGLGRTLAVVSGASADGTRAPAAQWGARAAFYSYVPAAGGALVGTGSAVAVGGSGALAIDATLVSSGSASAVSGQGSVLAASELASSSSATGVSGSAALSNASQLAASGSAVQVAASGATRDQDNALVATGSAVSVSGSGQSAQSSALAASGSGVQASGVGLLSTDAALSTSGAATNVSGSGAVSSSTGGALSGTGAVAVSATGALSQDAALQSTSALTAVGGTGSVSSSSGTAVSGTGSSSVSGSGTVSAEAAVSSGGAAAQSRVGAAVAAVTVLSAVDVTGSGAVRSGAAAAQSATQNALTGTGGIVVFGNGTVTGGTPSPSTGRPYIGYFRNGQLRRGIANLQARRPTRFGR